MADTIATSLTVNYEWDQESDRLQVLLYVGVNGSAVCFRPSRMYGDGVCSKEGSDTDQRLPKTHAADGQIKGLLVFPPVHEGVNPCRNTHTRIFDAVPMSPFWSEWFWVSDWHFGKVFWHAALISFVSPQLF